MRIALLTDGLFPYKIGGIQKHSLFLARYLAEAGIEVTVFFSHDAGQELVPPPEDLAETSQRARLRFIPVARPQSFYFPGHFIWESYRISKRFYAFLQRTGPYDFVFAQGFAGWYAAERRRQGKLDVPVGVHPHGVEMFQAPDSFRTILQQIFLRWAMKRNLALGDAVFALGAGMRGLLEKAGCGEKIFVSPNGIGAFWLQEEPSGEKEGVLELLFVGRYERRKGLPELSKVVSRLLAKGADLILHIVGPVPEAHRLSDPSVRYWGEVRDEARLREIFARCDVLVCPSHSEGMPTVILEGMASGLAILATRVGAVPDMVSEANGWLIPPMSEAALEVALLEVLACDRSVLWQKQQASRVVVKQFFLWSAVARTTLEEIQRAIRQSHTHEG